MMTASMILAAKRDLAGLFARILVLNLFCKPSDINNACKAPDVGVGQTTNFPGSLWTLTTNRLALTPLPSGPRETKAVPELQETCGEASWFS